MARNRPAAQYCGRTSLTEFGRGARLAVAALVRDIPLVILLFPDGRLTSRRWVCVLRGYAVAVGYTAVVSLIPAMDALWVSHRD